MVSYARKNAFHFKLLMAFELSIYHLPFACDNALICLFIYEEYSVLVSCNLHVHLAAYYFDLKHLITKFSIVMNDFAKFLLGVS